MGFSWTALRVIAAIATLVYPTVCARPNIIVMQPDDLPFFEEWNPPAKIPSAEYWSGLDLPNLDRLRKNGLEMKRAYASSPACGTSRYSTITGRFASRSSLLRYRERTRITIPHAKLEDINDVEDGLDCSTNNMAQLFKKNGYATGMFGKWHLIPNYVSYNYEDMQDIVRQCGFDWAEAVYWNNMQFWWTNGEFGHNMEYMTKMALDFMEESLDSGDNFFMYFNPTVPHNSGDIYEDLQRSCLDTPAGKIDTEPVVPGMTEGAGCDAYRQSVLDRANGDTSNPALGSIWLDDSVGALLTLLESRNVLNNTLFLFQLDHGNEGKQTLYESGVRIAQFVHYPDKLAPGSTFDGLVSTIDIAPTLADFAGINSSSPGWYDMDGISWKSQPQQLDRDCIVVEHEEDRGVICQCEKVLSFGEESNTAATGSDIEFITSSPAWINLCDSSGRYWTYPYMSPESESSDYQDSRITEMMSCHQSMTDPLEEPIYGACDYLMKKQERKRIHRPRG